MQTGHSNSNSPLKHADNLVTSKEQPKSYANRANLIKNIISNQEQEHQVNEAKLKRPNPNNADPFLHTIKSEASSSQESQHGDFTPVLKFNGESNTLLKALLQSAPKNAVVAGFKNEQQLPTPAPPPTEVNQDVSSAQVAALIAETSQAVLVGVPSSSGLESGSSQPPPPPIKQTKAPAQRKPRPPGQKKQAKMLMDLKNKILDATQHETVCSFEATSNGAIPTSYHNNTIASMTAHVTSSLKSEKDADTFTPGQNPMVDATLSMYEYNNNVIKIIEQIIIKTI